MTFAYMRDGDPADANPVPGQVGDDGRWEPGRAAGQRASR